MGSLADQLRFLRAFLTHPRQVGAVLPTSRWAVRDMLDLADVPGAELVVELGAGTGVTTGEVLSRMKPGARLIALEIDPKLSRMIEQRYPDPRLTVVADTAENIDEHSDGEKADVVVCALPFTSFDPKLRRRMLDLLPRVVADDGSVVVIQYSPIIQGELRKRFATVERRISPWNVPPAFLFRCSR